MLSEGTNLQPHHAVHLIHQNLDGHLKKFPEAFF